MPARATAPRVKTTRKVALLVETSRSYGRGVLRGIEHSAGTRSKWSLLHQEMTINTVLSEWIRESAIDEVIARVHPLTVDSLRDLDVPCVDVQCRGDFPGIPQVETDDRKVTELAFEHLGERGFRRFAFCGYQFAHYSEARLGCFRELVREASCSLSVYETPESRGAPVTRIEQTDPEDSKKSAWLASLEPPTGLFVCNDIREQQVRKLFQTLNLSVPDDIGVIGVEDDDTICPLSNPPLSSVQPNSEQVGYRAAEVLDAVMHGSSAPQAVQYISPEEVVQRLSTQVIAVEDREVARVCRFIREHACDGIDVHDVADFTSLPRRQLERRFRTELNRTPHEVTATQVAKVKQLLLEPEMTLEQIAPLAGYRHKERLSAVFRREVGEAPGEYRKRRK